ncbi:MAG: hypothetical protein ABIJ72_00670 [bacterium]
MKKLGIFLFFISLSIAAGVYGGVMAKNKTELKREISKTVEKVKETLPKQRFVWGAQGGAYALHKKVDTYSPDRTALQIKKAKELGINLIRANLETQIVYSPNYSIRYRAQDNDDYINQMSEAELDLLLVLEPNIPATVGKADYFAEGYTQGAYAAKRYGKKVKYFQLANEVTGTIAKPDGYTGETFKLETGVDYSKAHYDATLAWIKGMAKGIRDNDKSAKLLISGHWVLYDIVGKLIEDGADFDIIGWGWYSGDGVDVKNREFNYGKSLNLAQKLASYKKDLWIVEANRAGGSYSEKGQNGEEEQAQFFSKFLENFYSSKYFKGFIAYTLFDNTVDGQAGNPPDGHLGLVEVKFNGQENRVKSNKKAFEVYRKFISSHLELPTASKAPNNPPARSSSAEPQS